MCVCVRVRAQIPNPTWKNLWMAGPPEEISVYGAGGGGGMGRSPASIPSRFRGGRERVALISPPTAHNGEVLPTKRRKSHGGVVGGCRVPAAHKLAVHFLIVNALKCK